MPLPRTLARFNRRVTNHVLGPLANVTPPFAWVEHRGRRTGTPYRTPVWAFRTRSGFVIALTYGRETEWLRNVQAARGCTIEQRRRKTPVGNPRVVDAGTAVPLTPPPMRPVARLLGIENWLLLDR